jgi:4-hydroxy-tetrahydrodipicolinate synthase
VEESGLRDLTRTFKLFSGDDSNVVNLCQNYGGRGLISVASNVIPHEITAIVNACISGDFVRANELLGNSADFIKYLFVESNPVPVKEMLYAMRLCDTNKMRRPLMEMEDKDKINDLKNLFKILTNADAAALR